jgi:Tfp pilus assembly protein PilO
MSDNHWHLDKRVPIALIAGLLLQAAGFGWWAAAIDARVTSNARDITRVERQIEAIIAASQAQAVQLGRIEENLIGLRADISRLVRSMEGRGQ